MNCTQFQTAIIEAIEQRQPVSATLRQHVSSCANADCRSAVAEFDLLTEAVTTWMPQVERINLADSVLASLAAEEPQASTSLVVINRDSRAKTWQLAAAASVLVAAGAALFSPHRQSTSKNVAIRPNNTLNAVDMPAPKRLSAPQIGHQYVAWAEEAGSLVADAVVTVLPISKSEMPAAADSGSWTGDWMKHLEPAQREINEAIMYLEQFPGRPTPAT